MLKLTDLIESKELEASEMASVHGGTYKHPLLSIDFGTDLTNKVNDVDQVFAFSLGQVNEGAVANSQAFVGNKGLTIGKVDQKQDFHNDIDLSKIGTVSLS